jgi:hypothetical protein
MKAIIKYVLVKVCLIKLPTENCLKQKDALSPFLLDFYLEYAAGMSRNTKWD